MRDDVASWAMPSLVRCGGKRWGQLFAIYYINPLQPIQDGMTIVLQCSLAEHPQKWSRTK